MILHGGRILAARCPVIRTRGDSALDVSNSMIAKLLLQLENDDTASIEAGKVAGHCVLLMLRSAGIIVGMPQCTGAAWGCMESKQLHRCEPCCMICRASGSRSFCLTRRIN
jgi:hypothetical protein